MLYKYQPGAAPPVYVPIRAAPAFGRAATLASTWALKVVPSSPEYSFPSWLYVTAAPCWYTAVSILWPPDPFWAVLGEKKVLSNETNTQNYNLGFGESWQP